MKIVMYHYVRPDPVGLPYFRYLHVDDFRLQLDSLAASGRLISREEFSAAAEGGPVPEDAIVLTFDDGLTDHARWVFPELQARGMWGMFFVPSGPYVTGELLDVHRTHMILGYWGGPAAMAALQEVLIPAMIHPERAQAFAELAYIDQDNDTATTAFKRTLNYFMRAEYKDQVLGALMQRFGVDEQRMVGEFYMSPDDMRSMAQAGMVFGAHSVSHPVLSTLSPEAQDREIGDSFAFVEEAAGRLDRRYFCYPYGLKNTFSEDTFAALTRNRCDLAVSVDPRPVTTGDIRDKFDIPRFDCNLFPHGKARMGASVPAKGAAS